MHICDIHSLCKSKTRKNSVKLICLWANKQTHLNMHVQCNTVSERCSTTWTVVYWGNADGEQNVRSSYTMAQGQQWADYSSSEFFCTASRPPEQELHSGLRSSPRAILWVQTIFANCRKCLVNQTVSTTVSTYVLEDELNDIIFRLNPHRKSSHLIYIYLLFVKAQSYLFVDCYSCFQFHSKSR